MNLDSRSVQCPFCGAKRGKPCEDIGTRAPMVGAHRDRWYRAVEIADTAGK